MDHKNMDSVGEAVSLKIREAITNKLIELGVPFEKELPDYIMVMVANKKSRLQMEDDLFLFLGDGTAKFMDWFESIMKKFQSNSVKQLGEVSFPDSTESKSSDVPTDIKGRLETGSEQKPITSWHSESDVLTLEIPEQDADFLGEDLNEVSKATVISHSNSLGNRTLPRKGTCQVFQTSTENKVREVSAKKISLAVPESSVSLQQKSRIVPCSAVIPVKRSNIVTEVDSDLVEQSFGSVASIIRVTERKSSVPLALQANKLLLLKAVDAANKSVMAQQKPVKCSKSTHDENSVSQKPDLRPEKDMRIAVLVDDNEESSSLVTARRKPVGTSDSSDLLPEREHQRLNVIYTSPKTAVKNLVASNVKVACSASDPSFGCDAPAAIKTNNSEKGYSGKIDKACATEEETVQCCPAISPRFVVTLDGIDPATLKRKRKYEVPLEVDSDETCYPRAVMDADTKDFIPLDLERESVSSAEKKLKINEKCRYWPACKSGDLCNYHHPTTTCKAFPRCTYGDKCLFIHPNCKFDALCSKKDCPYTHASKRKVAAADVLSPKKSNLFTVIPCKYFPNCTSKNCTFFHPRTCWYGSQCKVLSCPYSHSLPVRDQLKWCAQ